MTNSTTFVPRETLVTAAWLNDVNDAVYEGTAVYTPAGTGAVPRTVQSKLRDTVSVKDFGAVGDGVTDDTAAIQEAVTYAYTNNFQLNFPSSTYLTVSSISNFHNVVKTGNGVIKRGVSLFYVEIQANQSNTLYVATTGSDLNDGLSAAQPILTAQKAFDTLKLYGPVLNGSWKIELAAGTYNNSATLLNLYSKNPIIIKGPTVGHPNVPTVIIDGTGVTTNSVGWYFQNNINCSLYDILFQNWTSVNLGCGFYADANCNVYTNNVHANNCYYYGLAFANLSIIRMQGGIIDDITFYGVYLYSQVSASIGYQGLTTAGTSTIIKNCTGAGVYAGNNTRCHIDYVQILNNDLGVLTEKNSRTVINYSIVTGNTYGVRTETCSVYGESGATNTFSSVQKNYLSFGSHDELSQLQVFWDRTTKRWLYGASAWATPNAKFEWQIGSDRSGSSYNSGVKAIFDFNTGGYLGISGPVTGVNGFLWSTVSKPAQATFAYDFSSDYFTQWVNGAESYRYYSTQFIPATDNNKTLGNSSARWSVVYAGTGVINTSDIREKEQIRSISDKEKAVAIKIKSLLKAFKFKDAVKEKGNKAPIHFGVIAQEVKTAFESEGLVVEDYALFCYDEWAEEAEVKDDEGIVIKPYQPAGNRYGIRYDDLLVFVISAL